MPLLAVEGIKKALAAAQAGSATISAQGVTVFHDIPTRTNTGQYQLHRDLVGLPLAGRIVCIGFDGGDTTRNPHVILAEARLARMLLDAGAEVRLLRIPFHPAGPKTGLDDYLVEQEDPRAALHLLQEAAINADPLVRARRAKASGDPHVALGELLKDLSFAASLHVAGAAAVDIVAAELRPVRKKAITESVEQFRRLLGASLPPRESEATRDCQGGALVFVDPEPWPETVDGPDLLDELLATLKRYVVFATEAAAVAVTLWIAFTYVVTASDAAPILALLSPQKRCGKTTLLRLLSALVLRALSTSNITPAALFRIIELACPTLLIDEADTFLRDNDDMRGLLNAGHTKETAFVIRTVGDNFEPRRFNVFGAKCIAAIGKLDGTLEDRALVVRMRRRAKGEAVERIPRALQQEAAPLCQKIFRWTRDHREELLEADPEISEELNDRAADNWRPLIAIADAAGGRWPETARATALEISAIDEDSESPGVVLLADLRDLFCDRKAERIPTREILEYLTALEERPWKDWRGRGLQPQGLRTLLRPFEIKASKWKTDGEDVRGYLEADFRDAWSRYLDQEGAVNPPHPPQARNDSGIRGNGSAAQADPAADAKEQIPLWKQGQGGWGGSAAVEEGEL